MPLSISSPLRQPAAPARSAEKIAKGAIPIYVYAVSLASLLTIIGILWDISWHRSIGRDKFLSPPHILIYLGAIFGGLFSGVQVLWNSFRPTAGSKASLVKIWGIFYSSLGALFCIWGAIAMLTSAPFDDWWHSAYGLDVTILSPPHTLLGVGMLFLEFGACVSISKYLNDKESQGSGSAKDAQRGLLQFLFVVSACSLLTMVFTLGSEFLSIRVMRSGLFYVIAALLTLLFVPAFGRALRMKWGMTAIALGYFLIAAVTNWVLPIFPAEPKLGPILTHTTHFQPEQFPLLIIVPALLMDRIMQRSKANDWVTAFLMSLAFVLIILIIQYPMSGFLLESPASRNWFFGGNTWYYGNSPDHPYRHKFFPEDLAPWPALAEGLGIAFLIGTISARISLRWGKWMQSVQR
jgi:hypothetical protein